MAGLAWTCLLPFYYSLLGSIGFLSVIRACLPLNIWRGLLIIFCLRASIFLPFYLKGLIEIEHTAVTFPVHLALMSLSYVGIFILATIYQKYEFD